MKPYGDRRRVQRMRRRSSLRRTRAVVSTAGSSGRRMRPSRTAVGLAIMVAITAPFVAGTSEPRANAQVWVVLTAGQRAEIAAEARKLEELPLFRDPGRGARRARPEGRLERHRRRHGLPPRPGRAARRRRDAPGFRCRATSPSMRPWRSRARLRCSASAAPCPAPTPWLAARELTHRIVASRTASAQPRSNSSRLIHSSIVCASFWPAPKVTVGMP